MENYFLVSLIDYWDWVILFCSKPTYTASLSFALEDEKSGGGLGGALVWRVHL
jgi:hypothetical protein